MPFFGAIALLAAAIGLPFFVVATSAPLLQRWFADTDHPAARDPYFLYAASNLGSLLALVRVSVPGRAAVSAGRRRAGSGRRVISCSSG